VTAPLSTLQKSASTNLSADKSQDDHHSLLHPTNALFDLFKTNTLIILFNSIVIFVLPLKGFNVKFIIQLTYILLICLATPLHAQQTTPLDDLVVPCVRANAHIDSALNKGARAVLFTEDGVQWPGQLTTINTFFRHHQTSLILAFSESFDIEQTKAMLQTQFQEHLHIVSNRWPSADILQKQKVIALFFDDLTFSSTQKVNSDTTYEARFSNDPLNRLVVFDPTAKSTLKQQCISFWKQTGKVPNLLLLEADEIQKASSTITYLNTMRRFKGEVKYQGKYLNEIRWKQHPALITPGKFSYPLTDYKEILSPYKNGFRISPGEVIHHTDMKDITRYFNAYDSSIDDALLLHLAIENKIQNLTEPDWEKMIIHDVEIVQDEKRGKVACFSNNNAYIDYAKENELNFDTPISIAVWLKPDSMQQQFMGILGLGSSFSLKLNNGSPDFTTATIKDHHINKQLAYKQWHHVAVVFNPNEKIDFFLNGEHASSMAASEIKPSNQSFLIGNNLWGEQFYGCLDDLRVWDRGLSEKEIKIVYLDQYVLKKSTNWHLYLFLCLVVIPLGAIIIWVKQKKQKPLVTGKNNTHGPDITKNQIRLFGTFQIETAKEGDVSNRFSPLLRQLLSFFILNSMENEKGISIKVLTDTFWPGASKEKAKENRNANLKKLRRLLDDLDGIDILYKEKKWHLTVTNAIRIDILRFEYLKTTILSDLNTQRLNPKHVEEFLNIIQFGNLLQDQENEWLDTYKSSFASTIIHLLLLVTKQISDPDKVMEIAHTVLKFDHLNEDALKTILSGFIAQGKHGQALQFYTHFCKKYKSLYNDVYPINFKEMIEK
jgi:DNA-binding SARP family transcriptional activator